MLRRYLSSFALVIVTATLSLAGMAQAATVAAPAQSGEGLSVSPPLITTSANPGQSVVEQISIRNITGLPLILSSSTVDFGAKGEDGTPQLLFNETTSTRYSLKYWIAPVESPTIQPGATITVPVTINIPANAEPGGHYGVVQFSGKPANLNGNGVSISASIGVLVLLTVNGNITQHLSPVDTLITQNGRLGTFFQYGPLLVSQRIRNDGDVHEAPYGKLTVSNLFGGKPIVLNVNPTKGNILPGSIRKFSEAIPTKNMFGYYTIKGSLAYGTNKTLVMPEAHFWVIPYTLLIIVVIVLVILFFVLRFALRRYNRHVINQARRR